jgi:beta-glucosidase-related glycosidases
MRKKGWLKSAAAVATSVVMMATAGMTPVMAEVNTFAGVAQDGRYYTDYTTLEDAQAAAAQLAIQIASEGDVLLKNANHALPLRGHECISIFGIAQDALAGSTTADVLLADALEAEGFQVNKSLRQYYEKIGTTFGLEDIAFDRGVENAYGLYGDVAIVVLSRGGGEGSDMPTVTEEEADEKDLASHTGYVTQADGKVYKHFLQLTDSEEALLDYVKAQGFKKIIYLVNSSEIFEMADLQNDDAIDGILWIGRPGQTGTIGAARILSGAVNPSGKTVDTWYADFTADPIWQNSIGNQQVGSDVTYTVAGQATDTVTTEAAGIGGTATAYHGVDYEEGIYVGYRYYETVAADKEAAQAGAGKEWYDKAVVYPFGYGLSYTDFQYSNLVVKAGDEVISDGATLDAAKLSSSVETGRAQIETMTVQVDVTNSGSVAGKETVEIYVKAPYTPGEVEKAHVKLVGFGKTDELLPGQTQTLTITVNVQDMASYDATDANHNGTKGYELDDGEYTLMAMSNAHGWAEQDAATYQAVSFTLNADAYLQLDDFSGNEISNLFSIENGIFYTLRDNNGKYQFNADPDAKETQLSRADFEGTFPVAPTAADLTIAENTNKSLNYWDTFNADDTENYGDNKTIDGVVYEADGYQTDYPWMADVEASADEMTAWDQTGTYGIILREMSGINPFSEDVLTDGRFAGKTGKQAWCEFMNSLTFDDEKALVGQLQKLTMDSISMNALNGQDSAWNYASTFNFTCNTILGATWNPELSRSKGVLIGNMALLSGNNTWWGNSANTHRSPFAGRVFEYPSEDPILTGIISSNETLGAVSRGLTTYMKHCALNDQETFRNGLNLFAWVSEQAVREIYFKSFQLCAQEGQATGVMGAFARAGRVSINVNYNYVTGLFRKEWGCDTISFTTDMYVGMKNCTPLDMLVRAGTDTIATAEMSGTWDADKKAVVLADGTVSAAQWYTTRQCAMIFLWTHANTAMNNNGIDFSDWTAQELHVSQAVAPENLDVKSGVEAQKMVYTISSGELPSGLTLNEDGTITGTPTAKAGVYTFGVQAAADNWVKAKRQYTMTIDTAFTIDETEAYLDEEFFAAIQSDMVNVDNYSQGVVYSLKEGKLPAGLTLNENGEITGTPSETGNFTITVGALATNEVRVGWRRVTTVDDYEYEVTISVVE